MTYVYTNIQYLISDTRNTCKTINSTHKQYARYNAICRLYDMLFTTLYYNCVHILFTYNTDMNIH